MLLTVKAHQVGPIAADLKHLIGPETSVVTMQNGIPWWYFTGGHGGQYEGTQLETADPGGLIAQHLDPAPGDRLRGLPGRRADRSGHGEGHRGQPLRPRRARRLEVRAGARHLAAPDQGRLQGASHHRIRSEIWLKLWGNLSFNPISALTHATLEDICRFPDTRALATEMMKEAEQIANTLGITFRVGIDRRIAGAEKVGAHKTSMLQDVEAGRPIELEALVGSVIELGRLVGVATPHIDSVYALMRLLAQSLERANGRLAIASA